MRRRRSRLPKYVLIALLALLAGGLGLRWHARQAALLYGKTIQQALFEQEDQTRKEGRAKRRELFEEPEMRAAMATLSAWWNPAAIDYRNRAEDLRMGLVYLHIQLGLPTAERFRRPPKLAHFTVDPGDKTDEAVLKALRVLLEDYLDYVGTR